MHYERTTLQESLEGILKVAAESFTQFYTKNAIFKRVEGRKYWVYVARDGLTIVGFKVWYEDEGQIYSWIGAVRPDYRKRGIANELMNLQFASCQKLGYKTITLKTHEGHPEMIALCMKRGFHEVRREPGHWGDERTALFFTYDLSKEKKG